MPQNVLAPVITLARGLVSLASPTLLRRAKRDVNRHYQSNETLRRHRYRGAQGVMSWITQHPVFTFVSVLAVYGITITASALIQHVPFMPTVGQLPDDFGTAFLAINSTILGAQATFIGLVFPLVIALVGMLSANKIGFNGRLSIYIKESEAVFVGGSSLLLAGMIALWLSPLGIAPLPLLPERVVAAVTGLHVVWFAANLFALGHFLWRTIDYLRSDQREEMLRKYVANCAYRTELMDFALARAWRHAIENGDKPRAIATHLPQPDRPSVSVGYVDREPQAQIVSRQLKRPRRLCDVNVAMLDVVIRQWLNRANGVVAQPRSRMIFPIEPGNDFDRDVQLIRITGNSQLTPAERALTNWAHSFRGKRRLFKFIEVTEILRETAADLVRLSEEGRSAEFESLLKTSIETLRFFLEIVDYQPLRAGGNARARRFDDFAAEIVRAFLDVVAAATQHLDRSVDQFRSMAYFGYSLSWPLNGQARAAALQIGLMMDRAAARELMAWAYRATPTAQQQSSFAGSLVTLEGSVSRQYGAAWRYFVAGWEQLLSTIARGQRGDQLEATPSPQQLWDDFRDRALSAIDHLHRTINMTAEAASRGDALAVSWTTDLLVNWLGTVTLSIPGSDDTWALETDALTSAVLSVDWATINNADLDRGERLPPGAVVNGALENEWIDATNFLSLILIRWAAQLGGEGAAALAARNVLHRIGFDSGGRRRHRHERLRTHDILLSILRMSNRSTLVQQERSNGLDDLGDGIAQLTESTPVMMRVYSRSGSRGPDGFRREQALLLVAATPGREEALGVSQALRYFMLSARDEVRRDILVDLEALQLMLEAAPTETELQAMSFIYRENAGQPWEQRRARVAALVAGCIALLNERRQQEIREAPVDENRLRAVAMAAGWSAYAKASGEFPLSVFGQIHPRPGRLESFTLRMLNQQRGAYTNPLFANEFDDGSFWDETMRGRVAAVAMSLTLRQLTLRVADVRTAEEYWSAVKAAEAEIRTAGFTPILVIAGGGEPSWLSDWLYNHGATVRPSDMRIWHKPEAPRGYQFSINEFDVFSGAIGVGRSCVIAIEWLGLIEFQQQSPDEPITDVTFTPDTADATRGSLNLRFGASATIRRENEALGRDIRFGNFDARAGELEIEEPPELPA